MNPLHQKMLDLSYDENGKQLRSRSEVARLLGVTPSRVSQVIKYHRPEMIAKPLPPIDPPVPEPPIAKRPCTLTQEDRSRGGIAHMEQLRARKNGPKDIIDMITSDLWLGEKNLSPAQISILKAIYGIPMTRQEREVFLPMTEGREPRAGGYNEVTIIAGTGSGKTGMILAPICVYEAITFDVTRLAPGETAVIPLVAQDERGANIALGYCEERLRILKDKGHDSLMTEKPDGLPGARAREVVGGEIRVRKNVVIRTYPCKKVSTRGISAIMGAMDEFAHWRTEAKAYNSDREIQRALKGRRRAHTPNFLLVKITSPFGEDGIAFEDYQERAKARRLFVQAPTWILNPALSRESMADEEHDDPDAFMRERGAQFGKVDGSFISAALVDSCTRPDRPEIAPKEGIDYTAAMDVAFKGDLYVVGVAHQEALKVIIDGIWWRQGTKERPLDDDEVAAEMGGFLKPYDIDRIFGDQFADVPTKKAYQNLGVTFIMEAQTAATNMQMFKNLKAAMRRRLIELPPDPMVRKDLTCLIQTKPLGSNIWRCAAPDRSGMHDDISKVIAMLNLKLMAPVSGLFDHTALNHAAVSAVPQEKDWADNIMEAVL